MVFGFSMQSESNTRYFEKNIALLSDMNLCMGDPDEKAWIRDRIEGPEKNISFTDNGKKQF